MSIYVLTPVSKGQQFQPYQRQDIKQAETFFILFQLVLKRNLSCASLLIARHCTDFYASMPRVWLGTKRLFKNNSLEEENSIAWANINLIILQLVLPITIEPIPTAT